MVLVELGNLHAGQTVVAQGTGGVSLFAVQLAAAHGAGVIVTSGSDQRIARAIALGASYGINRNATPEWQHAVLKMTGGRGADHILEMTGGENVERSLQAVAQGARISLIGLCPVSARHCCENRDLSGAASKNRHRQRSTLTKRHCEFD
jgi:NADPH:quinone reductase-like Zn-dependent oxidoreductase